MLALVSVGTWANTSTDIIKGMYPITWDRSLAVPPTMSADEVALAEMELLPENVNMTFVAYASQHGQKYEGEQVDEFRPYVEVQLTYRTGRKSQGDLFGRQVYLENPLGDSGYSVWASGYKDQEFKSVLVGIAKKEGNWQVGLGLGSAWYDEKRRNVVSPWLFYSSDEYEGLLLAERYMGDSKDPWFYKGYAKMKVGDFGIGVYGEKGMGIGPMLSYKLTKSMELWGTVPVAKKPSEGGFGLLIGFKWSF